MNGWLRLGEAPYAFPRTASPDDPQECGALRQGTITFVHSAPTGEKDVVMPGLVPGIHVLPCLRHIQDVDGRDRPGHDEKWICEEKSRGAINARYGSFSSPRAAPDWPCPESSTSRSRRACRRRPRGSRPCSSLCPWRRLPLSASSTGSCGRSPPDSSDRCSGRRCGSADARRGAGTPRPRVPFGFCRQSPWPHSRGFGQGYWYKVGVVTDFAISRRKRAKGTEFRPPLGLKMPLPPLTAPA